MKTTLVLDDRLVARLKREALASGSSMSDIVEAALHAWFKRANEVHELEELPIHSLGRPRVDIADRGVLYDAMEGR